MKNICPKKILTFAALAMVFAAVSALSAVSAAGAGGTPPRRQDAASAPSVPQLSFDTKAYEAVNHWVAFPPSPGKDPRYMYGFVYIDLKAGFTFQFESVFKVEDGKLLAQPTGTFSKTKLRVSSGTRDVAVLTPEQVAELGLPAEPEWLRIYRPTESGVEYMKEMGYCYNDVGAYDKALEYLEPAYGQEPHYKGLEFELAFAYNALKRFDQAVAVLNGAIENTPDDPFLYRELGYALKWKGDMEGAEKAYTTGMEKSSSDKEKAEMASNMAQGYFFVRNRDKYRQWVTETAKYATPNSQWMRLIDACNAEWDKPDTIKLPPAGTIPAPAAPAAE